LGDPAKVAGTCTVTIAANDFATGAPLANFTYIINVDNTKLPNTAPPGQPLSTESNSPIVRARATRPTRTSPCRRPVPDHRCARSIHKMWGTSTITRLRSELSTGILRFTGHESNVSTEPERRRATALRLGNDPGVRSFRDNYVDQREPGMSRGGLVSARLHRSWARGARSRQRAGG
jgi:hypothetical protein